MTLISTVNLSQSFGDKQVFQNISIRIPYGKTLGLVGESGSGKTTLGRCILGLIQPTSGKIFYKDQSIENLKGHQRFPLRKRMQMIFQDPFSSLNPQMTAGQTLEEPLVIHRLHERRTEKRIKQLLDQVGLPLKFVTKYPHELSGGQKQRLVIARALAVEPEFIVCDEPVSALDVSVQAQIVNLLLDLQKELKLSYLFISHDLRLVCHMSDEVCVIYNGSIVESKPGPTFFTQASDPYSKMLISAQP